MDILNFVKKKKKKKIGCVKLSVTVKLEMFMESRNYQSSEKEQRTSYKKLSSPFRPVLHVSNPYVVPWMSEFHACCNSLGISISFYARTQTLHLPFANPFIILYYKVISYWPSYRFEVSCIGPRPKASTSDRGPVTGPKRNHLINDIFINKQSSINTAYWDQKLGQYDTVLPRGESYWPEVELY